MLRSCERCGKEFESRDPRYRTCQECWNSPSKILGSLLLPTYYDAKEDFKKEVFIDIPERIAKVLYYDGLSMKQIRYFYDKILRVKERALLKNFDSAKPILYEIGPEIQDKINRGVKGFPETFATFLRHHLSLAEKSDKNLEGFFKHLKAVLANMPRRE